MKEDGPSLPEPAAASQDVLTALTKSHRSPPQQLTT